MNKTLVFSGLFIGGLAVVSAPYFMGKNIESKINESISEFDKSGITVTSTSKVNYLNTTFNGKITINDIFDLVDNLSKNHLDKSYTSKLQKLVNDLNSREKREIKQLFNGTEVIYTSTIDNINPKPFVIGHISKLSNTIDNNMKIELSKNDVSPIAKKISSMIKDKKLGFVFENNRLNIKDINETIKRDNDKLDFNLKGLNFGEKDSTLGNLNFNLKTRRDSVKINLDKLRINYDIKNSKNYKNDISIDKLLLFSKNEVNLTIENFYTDSSLETNTGRSLINFSFSFNKINLSNNKLNAIINKSNFKVKANLDEKGLEEIQNIDYTQKSRYINKEFESAAEVIISNTPNFKANIDLNGISINGMEIGSQIKADVDLKLIKIHSIDELKNVISTNNPKNLIKYFEGSTLKILGDDKATKSASATLLSQGIRPVKSDIKGFNQIVVSSKNGSILINEKKRF